MDEASHIQFTYACGMRFMPGSLLQKSWGLLVSHTADYSGTAARLDGGFRGPSPLASFYARSRTNSQGAVSRKWPGSGPFSHLIASRLLTIRKHAPCQLRLPC